ncbi:hypothetical protein IVB56_35480 [Bradyrhizobium sp. CW7]|uniref:hypothetical protein n=1 Tax=Bradyrhizobium sp. CW7 TaxID=2782688 RepID=UPI001FF9ECEC|nr:hypothetical protein [Bradyrhizobium sp. CW7]MCK1356230.1 hypothetical protein [Bradyrhizobium sp. CW7]
MLFVTIASPAVAQDAGSYEKQSYNYSEWAKGRFSEVVTVKNPGRLLFLGGIGAEDVRRSDQARWRLRRTMQVRLGQDQAHPGEAGWLLERCH